MSTLQHTQEIDGIDDATPVEALGTEFESLFPEAPPVYNVVDPDALNSLFAPRSDGTARVDGTVTFTYRGYEFSVAADGDVTVEEA